MSMNKDLVAEAVAAIPLWIAFLDQKEAEQDALIEKMQTKREPSFIERAISPLKKEKDDHESPPPNNPPSAASSSDQTPPINLSKQDQSHDDTRWAPIEEGTTTEIVEPVTETAESEFDSDHQFKNMF